MNFKVITFPTKRSRMLKPHIYPASLQMNPLSSHDLQKVWHAFSIVFYNYTEPEYSKGYWVNHNENKWEVWLNLDVQLTKTFYRIFRNTNINGLKIWSSCACYKENYKLSSVHFLKCVEMLFKRLCFLNGIMTWIFALFISRWCKVEKLVHFVAKEWIKFMKLEYIIHFDWFFHVIGLFLFVGL